MNARVIGRIPEADVLGYIWPEMIAVCPKCNQTKKKIDFHKSTKTKSGLYSCCKDCRKKMDHKRHQMNRLEEFMSDIFKVYDKYSKWITPDTINSIDMDFNREW